jgi:hypothetical protein
VAFTEIELRRIERDMAKFMERRRPRPHIRPELDIGHRVSGHSVELFEIRPVWDNPKQKLEHPIAKAIFVRTQELWRVFWMRQDFKWHSYEPFPNTRHFEAFLAAVDRDEYCCFFG